MTPSRSRRFRPDFPVFALTFALATTLLSTGCGGVFTAKHRVLVDAISAPDATPPTGKSYRLVAKPAVLSGTPGQVSTIKACVDAALGGQGMFEAPPNTPPDMFIEVGYGRDSAPRAEAAVRETFLQLSARANPAGSPTRSTGPELWDVRVAVLGITGAIENAMPLLASVAANHLAKNTLRETLVDVPQNSPLVETVRTAAIKSLETKALPAAPAAPSATGPAPNAPAPNAAPGGGGAGAPAPAATTGSQSAATVR